MRNKLILGAGAGFAGAWVMTALIYLLNMIPGISIEFIQRLSTLFVVGIRPTMNNQIMGLIAHLVCGSVVGIGILVVLDYFATDYFLLKGIGAGLITWFLLCGVVSRLLGIQLEDKFIDAFLLMLLHIPFGFTTVWFIDRRNLSKI